MAIKDILTVVDLNGKQAAPKLALDLASRTGAHVTGLSIAFEPVVPGFIAAPMPADYIEIARDSALKAAAKAGEAFSDLARKNGVSSEVRTAEMITGGTAEPVISHCRFTDLVVIGQDNPDEPEPMRETLIEAVLFESGVPVLVVPYIGSQLKMKNVLVAWDGSPTASRAVHAALPLLAMAEKVTVMMVETGKVSHGQPGADIATYLARHNLDVTVDLVPRPQTGIADAILNYVSDQGVDMVAMGGYGHSRMREFLFGGATREILAAMTVPILMAH
ncbi:universal stress protein [Stappia sp. GBMRC 2046]|uniref:Universal stress protein n=1 Tax=Stappia sediminis TaxID=2692190 RepID=A0A7X3LW59_9HYPH|nr:universal stress protein [Stappia sediminis]MXN66222.1 universal stress protein [Stappia sediminis]